MALTKVSRGLLSTSIEDNGTSTAITIDSSEKVGIGTTSPVTPVHVKSAENAVLMVESTDTKSTVSFKDDTTSNFFGVAVGAIGDNLIFQAGSDSVEDMRLTSSGQLGIGTSAPEATLHIVDIGTTGPALHISGGGGTEGDITTPHDETLQIGHWNESTDTFTERMQVNVNGNVGIGTTGPGQKLTVGGTDARIYLTGANTDIDMDNSANGQLHLDGSAYGFGIALNGDGAQLYTNSASRDLIFGVNETESARITPTNYMVGTTTPATTLGISTSSSDTGVSMSTSGRLSISNSNSYPLALNRHTSEGSLIQLNEAGVTRGAIGIKSNEPFMVDASGGLRMSGSGTPNVLPCNSVGNATNQALNLGSSTLSFDTIFADDVTETSDRNYKQDIEELSEAELRVATTCKGLMRKYRMKRAVAKKGDDARIHVGIIAQELRDAFTAEGLDAGRYGMFVSETVWEDFIEVPAVEAVDAVYETQTDEEGNETQVLISEAIEAVDAYTDVNHYWTEEEAPDTAVARTKMGIRYSQLLAFIIAAL